MDEQQLSSLTSQQKVGFSLLLIFGLLVVGLGFLQMRSNIYSPLLQQQASTVQQRITRSAGLDETIRLQQIDTDQDGLSDFEEFEFYQTSPYLPDTDSDGVTDRDEITAGTDPLCPEGGTCESGAGTGRTSSTPVTSPIAEAPTASDLLLGAIEDTRKDEQVQEISEEELAQINLIASDPEALRAILLSTGQVTEEQLAQFDDETLLRLSAQVLSRQTDATQ